MSKRRYVIGYVIVIVLSAAIVAYDTGPPNGRAGDPPSRMNCTQCHESFTLNSGNGMLSIDNVPDTYTPGDIYTITVTLSDPGQSRWGFELTMLDDDNDQAGTMSVTDDTNTQLSDNSGSNPDYIKHTMTGTFAGTPDGPVSWSFDWTAPSPPVGDITFYAAGNAANNNDQTTGDYIYTTTAVSASLIEAPVADFSGDPTSGCAPLTVEFTDQSTGEITSWDWSFGDGESSTEQNPMHQYQDTGNFTVSLLVTGPGGDDSEIKNSYIIVDPPPQANFSGTPTQGPPPLTVQFTDLSAGDIEAWSWDFGDDGTSTEQNPSHEYQTEGTFTVTLTATGPCGSDIFTQTDYITVGIITVDVAMTDDLIFDPDPVTIGAGQAVRWTTTGTVPHTSTSGTGPEDPGSGQLWDSGLLGTGESFTFQFEDAGTYPYYCIPHFAQGMTGTVIVCELPVGDINGDGSPDVVDVLALVNHILGLEFLQDCRAWKADCNQDGILDIIDALGIIRVILGVGTCP